MGYSLNRILGEVLRVSSSSVLAPRATIKSKACDLAGQLRLPWRWQQPAPRSAQRYAVSGVRFGNGQVL